MFVSRIHLTCQLRATRSLMLFKDVPLRTRRAILPYKVCVNGALLVLNRTSLSIFNTLLALNWWYIVVVVRVHFFGYFNHDVKTWCMNLCHHSKSVFYGSCCKLLNLYILCPFRSNSRYPTFPSGSPSCMGWPSSTPPCRRGASLAPWAGTSPTSSTRLTSPPASSLSTTTWTTWIPRRYDLGPRLQKKSCSQLLLKI